MSLIGLLCAASNGPVPDEPPTPGQSSGNLLLSGSYVLVQPDARFVGLCKSGTNELMAAYRKSANHAVDTNATHVVRFSSNGGKAWGDEITVFDPSGYDPRDCTVSQLSDGRIALTAFNYGTFPDIRSQVLFSSDNGRTFGSPVQINPSGLAYTDACSGPVIECANGDLLIALYGQDAVGEYHSAVVCRSTDDGATWSASTTIADGPATIGNTLGAESEGHFYEPFLLKLANGDIIAAVRHSREKVWIVRSVDDGVTWGTPVNTNVPGGGRPAIAQVSTGGIVLCNRTDTYIWYRTSWDNGVTWSSLTQVTTGYRGAYSQMVEYRPGKLAHFYSMETVDGDTSEARFTYMYDNNLPDPLTELVI